MRSRLGDCRLLGLPPEASFEEVQDARNFLYEVMPRSECCPCILHPCKNRLSSFSGCPYGPCSLSPMHAILP